MCHGETLKEPPVRFPLRFELSESVRSNQNAVRKARRFDFAKMRIFQSLSAIFFEIYSEMHLKNCAQISKKFTRKFVLYFYVVVVKI